jgi:serine/threonine protein kinase
MDNLIGRDLGRYHILEQLGEGGMATVYKAFDTRLERYVAIKVILTQKQHADRFLKRFEREARALAQLTHSNIVGIIDYGEYEGSPYLVMEYLPSGTLKHRLGKPIPYQEASRVLAPIARALAYAHEQKIIHRDVKPANILITHSGEPMLSDFGIAKILEAEETVELTGTGVGIGTPEYMSPEQAQGKPVDARSDIYSLGVVFFEMVTGRKPYQADTPMAVVWKLASEPLPRPRQFVGDLPDAVEGVLLKALAKKPEDRYPDMSAFAVVLDGLASSHLKSSKPPRAQKGSVPKAPSQLGKKQSSKKWLPIVITTVFLVAVIAAGASLFRMEQKGSRPLAFLQTKTSTSLPISLPAQTLTRIPTNTREPTIASTTTLNYAVEKTITVSAQSLWQNTGIVLIPGDVVNIQHISGQWGWTGEVRHGAIGDSQSCLKVCGPIASSCPIQAANEGALVGRVGNDIFVIGQQVTYTNNTGQPDEQMLELRMNDCDLGVQDNFGSIEVKIGIISKTATVTIPAQITDGELLFRWCSSDWATCRNAAQGNATWVGLTVTTIGAGHDTSGFTIERGFLTFDTTPIPANVTINSATLHFYTGAFLNGNTTIHVVRSFANVSLSNSDYGMIEYNSGGSTRPSNPFTWYEMDIQEEALSWIKLGQITSLALIHDYDLRNTIPTSGNDVLIATSEDEQHRPYLTITYTNP